MQIVTIQNLKKIFKDKEVLKGINLEIPENSIFGFIGKNGAGKTTTMKSILGLLKVDEGSIKIYDDIVTFGENKTNKYIGYLPDVPEFYRFMNAREYLKLCGEALGLANDIVVKRTEELLTLVGLANEVSRIKGYSRGMKQRLGIAQALLGKPKLLICDEPTSALDPKGRKEILDILSSVKNETTVLFSTHILTDVERICTHVVFLDEGVIKLQGKIDEIKKMHQSNEYIIQFLDENHAKKISKRFELDLVNPIEVKVLVQKLNEVLAYMIKENIAFSKIEFLEKTLESFYLEVIQK
ncbi:ABC transporter ATP-binding protein [Acholeplasma hippikon]|nr:ABC transporter ATP-binding protein [Acholeplasma hippikon]